jgi:hypothetical protein
VKRRYSHEILSRIRAHETSQRAREAADAAERRRGAEQRLVEATRKTEAEKDRLRAASDVESLRLGSGRARAADLARTVRFRHDAERRIAAHEESEASAVREAAESSTRERRAAAALEAAHTAEKVVLEHRDRLRQSERRSRAARDDEALEDAARARRAIRGQKDR